MSILIYFKFHIENDHPECLFKDKLYVLRDFFVTSLGTKDIWVEKSGTIKVRFKVKLLLFVSIALSFFALRPSFLGCHIFMK